MDAPGILGLGTLLPRSIVPWPLRAAMAASGFSSAQAAAAFAPTGAAPSPSKPPLAVGNPHSRTLRLPLWAYRARQVGPALAQRVLPRDVRVEGTFQDMWRRTGARVEIVSADARAHARLRGQSPPVWTYLQVAPFRAGSSRRVEDRDDGRTDEAVVGVPPGEHEGVQVVRMGPRRHGERFLDARTEDG